MGKHMYLNAVLLRFKFRKTGLQTFFSLYFFLCFMLYKLLNAVADPNLTLYFPYFSIIGPARTRH